MIMRLRNKQAAVVLLVCIGGMIFQKTPNLNFLGGSSDDSLPSLGTRVESNHPEKAMTERYERQEPDRPGGKYLGGYDRTIDSFEELPPASSQGCNDRGLCQLSNVCVSGANGVLVPNQPGADEWIKYYGTGLEYWDAHRPRVVKSFPPNMTFHFVDSIFVANCIRQPISSRNPAHLMGGLGNLFVAATGYYDTNYWGAEESNGKKNHPLIVYHQCMDMDTWEWGTWVEKIIWDFAFSRSFVSFPWEKRNHARLILPWHDNEVQPNDLVVCGKRIQSDFRGSAAFQALGNNSAEALREWGKLIQKVVFNETENDLVTTRATQIAACEDKSLRIAIWNRTDAAASVNGLRLFRNLDEVQQVVLEFTSIKPKTISLTIETPPPDQAALFRSYDILLSPLGAHLFNNVFSRPNQTVIIQVSPVELGDVYTSNHAFTKKFIGSYGHQTWNDTELEKERQKCTRRYSEYSRECFLKFFNSDMIVNLRRLRMALTEAVQALCSD